MPSDDLNSIPGLEDKHLRVLARQHIADLRGLVQADRRVIYQAMRNLRPRPALEQISRWQDDARSNLAEAVVDASDWRTAASFVVVFSQRQVEGTWERRAEVEQTEVEPERNLQVWPGWDCGPICGWMLEQLSPADGAWPVSDTAPENGTADDRTQPADEPAGAATLPAAVRAADRARLRIDSAVIADATGPADLVTAGVLIPYPPAELVAPVRVAFTISGAQPGTPLQAVARILRQDGPGWNPRAPVPVPGSGRAEFDLSEVPAGEHQIALIAWAPDATATPVSVRLPRVTIRPGSS